LEIPDVSSDSFLQINFFVDFDPRQERAVIRSFLPNGPPELRKAIRIPSSMNTQLHALHLQNSDLVLKMNPIVCVGEPTIKVAFGF